MLLSNLATMTTGAPIGLRAGCGDHYRDYETSYGMARDTCCIDVFLTALGGAIAQAENITVIPRATSLIVDQDGMLTETERTDIGARLKRIEDEGRTQIGILISGGTGDEEMASYALRVAEAWRLGSKNVDNGLLILIVPSKRSARLEVGYGLEGAIPDAYAARIARNYL